MKWSLVAGAIAAARVAHADCYVHNNTDHEIRLYDGLPVNGGRPLLATTTIKDSNQTLELSCSIPDEHLKLVGTAGAVTVEHLPPWFRAYADEAEVRVSATKKAARVEVDGKPVKLGKGETTQAIDARAKLLAGDPATIFDEKRRNWHIPIEVKATAGTESATLVVDVELNRAMRALVEDLHAAEKVPVGWAATADHGGPAIVFGCVSQTGPAYKAASLRNYELVRSPATLAALSLVAICEPTWVKVDTCPKSTDKFFANDPLISRYRVDGKVTLVEAKTSKVVASTTLRGGEPAACSNTATQSILGDVPNRAALLEWINSVK